MAIQYRREFSKSLWQAVSCSERSTSTAIGRLIFPSTVDQAKRFTYPSEHYDYWKRELPEMKLPWGMFGENFTSAGLFESELNIGDKFRVGSAVVMVTEPRMPCYKLGIKFGRSDMIKRFLASERTGFYFAVLQEGEVGVGDQIELIESGERSVRVSDITQLYTREKHNIGLLRRATEVAALPESWRSYFKHRLQKLTGRSPD